MMATWRNKKIQRAWQRKRYAERRLFILKYKKDYGGCKKCGWNERDEVLVFHHRNKKNKSFHINGHHIANCSIDRLKKEMVKCDLLCPNCHAILHYNERDWFQELGRRNKKKEKLMVSSKKIPIYNNRIRKVVLKGLKDGLTGYSISKKYKLNKKTVYNYIHREKRPQ